MDLNDFLKKVLSKNPIVIINQAYDESKLFTMLRAVMSEHAGRMDKSMKESNKSQPLG